MAKWREVSVSARRDSILRAGLYAGIAIPAHIRFYIVGTTIGLIDVHDVGWTDIDTMAATVAAGHVNKCRHDIP